jgi:hypothetical protein
MSVKGGGCLEKKNENFEFLTRSTRQTGPTGEKKINQFSKMALIPKHRQPEKNRLPRKKE